VPYPAKRASRWRLGDLARLHPVHITGSQTPRAIMAKFQSFRLSRICANRAVARGHYPQCTNWELSETRRRVGRDADDFASESGSPIGS